MRLIKYYISDLHFSHQNILTFDSRPFYSIEDMNAAIVDNWNKTVKTNDEVYILGDMFWDNGIAPEILKKLIGKKFLICGNHDRLNSEMSKYFIWVKDLATVSDKGCKIVLCHYPIAHWKGQYNGTMHFYGHVHMARDTRPFEEYKKICQKHGIPFEAYNVGCMLPYMNFTPRTAEEIIRGANGLGDNAYA